MRLQRSVLRTLGNKLNLGLVCAILGVSGLLRSVPLLFSVAVVLGVLTVLEVRASRRRLLFCPPRIPRACTFKHGAIRSVIDAISASQKERIEVVDACPEELLTAVRTTLRAASEAEALALRLARQADGLYGYLAMKSGSFTGCYLTSAKRSAESAKTQAERQCYEAAARTIALEAAALGAIDEAVRLTLAKLETIRASLAAVRPRIMKLQAAGATMDDGQAIHLCEDLCLMGSEIDEVEEHLRSLCKDDGEHGMDPLRIAPLGLDLRFGAASDGDLMDSEGLMEAEQRHYAEPRHVEQ